MPFLNQKLVCFATHIGREGSVLDSAGEFFRYMQRAIDNGTVAYAIVLSVYPVPIGAKDYSQVKRMHFYLPNITSLTNNYKLAWVTFKRQDNTQPYAIFANLAGSPFSGCFFPINDLLSEHREEIAERIKRRDKRKRDDDEEDDKQEQRITHKQRRLKVTAP